MSTIIVPSPSDQSTVSADAAAAIERAAALLRGRRFSVLTGAGVSTDSGIPDYRGQGSTHRTPMLFSQFRTDPRYRQRYWAGSHLGRSGMEGTQPNAGHLALAGMEGAGHLTGLITQNVDGLHRLAGSENLVELHGALDQVVCLRCGEAYHRDAIALQIRQDNPGVDSLAGAELAPDGDRAPERFDDFVVPVCRRCGGMLKPDMVFFGEFVPALRFETAKRIVAASQALLVAGSSLTVNSGIRLVEVARRAQLPVVVINRGPTKADAIAKVRLEAGTSESLAALAERL